MVGVAFVALPGVDFGTGGELLFVASCFVQQQCVFVWLLFDSCYWLLFRLPKTKIAIYDVCVWYCCSASQKLFFLLYTCVLYCCSASQKEKNLLQYVLHPCRFSPTRRDAGADVGPPVSAVAEAQQGLGDEDTTAVQDEGGERGDGRVIEVIENR